MRELHSVMKRIFDSIDGLSSDMVATPKELVAHRKYDVLFADETHRLYRRYHLLDYS